MLDAGDHIICEEDLYGGTGRLLNKVMNRHGLETTMVDFTQPALIEAAIRAGKTKVSNRGRTVSAVGHVVDSRTRCVRVYLCVVWGAFSCCGWRRRPTRC